MPQTRSQRQRLLQEVVRQAKIKNIVHFEDENALYVFTINASANLDVGLAVEHLTIAICKAYSIQLLCDALQLVPNLTDLIVILPDPFPSRLLDGLMFNGLQFLKTNIPHSHLTIFLSAHSALGFLDLGPCSRSCKCPLMTVNLSSISDIHCPIECCTMLVHLGVTRVRVDLTHPQTIISLVFRSFPIQFFAVYTLSLQFNPTNDDILMSIVKFVPMVRVLQLWEQADCTPLHPLTSCPWQYATKLRDNLLKMRFLDHLIVQMMASFVSVPGLTRECTVIFKWIGENTVSRKHPHLKFVAVWYRATQFGAGTLTKWWKDDEVWTGASVDSPTEDDLGVVL